MITLENINKTFYTSEVETRALEDINLTVEKGEFVAIMGPSGCGKSTMLKVIAGVIKPTFGEVRKQGSVAPMIELGAGFDFDLKKRRFCIMMNYKESMYWLYRFRKAMVSSL